VERQIGRRFYAAYADKGRPSVPPEQMIKAMLLHSLNSLRSQSQIVKDDEHANRPARNGKTLRLAQERLCRRVAAAGEKNGLAVACGGGWAQGGRACLVVHQV